jgi:hypothetical protein
MAQNNERNPHIVLIPIGAVGAGLTVKVAGPKVLRDAIILGAALVDTVAVGASGSAYVSAALQDHTASDAVVASGDTKLGLAAYEGLDLALNPTPSDPLAGSAVSGPGATADTIVDKGHTLDVVCVSHSSAVLTNAVLAVSMYYL